MLYKDRLDSESNEMSQHKFEQLVDSDQIVHATINYDPQSPALNEVVGTYYRIEKDARIETPFRAKVRLTGGLEQKLLSLPQFEPRQPNTVLMSLVVSVLPIIVIAALIWFFFIRQIRRVARNSPSTPDLQTRTVEQQDRLDKILDKWEQQARRMDGVLDRMERERKEL
jgi:ATP-dependent Zn protease